MNSNNKDILLVKECLLEDFSTCKKQETIQDLLDSYQEKSFSFALIEESKEEASVSLISAFKLLQAGLNKKNLNSKISAIVPIEAPVIVSSASIITALDLMNEKDCDFLLVKEEEAYQGVLTRKELQKEKINFLSLQEMKVSELERRLEQKEEYIGIVSHDLKSPLSVILICIEYLDSIEAKLKTLSEEQKDFLERIKRNAQKTLDLVSDLLDLGHVKSGIELKFEETSLPGYLKEIIENAHIMAGGKNISFKEQISQDIAVKIDRRRFQQVLENILGNAIKFSPAQGEILISTRVESNDKGEDIAVISVKDNGPGISTKNFEDIFEKFNQGDIKALKSLGVGLGLSIAREFAELNGAKIKVESTEGSGSTFSIHIATIQTKADSSDESSVSEGKLTILVVDDDDDIREYLTYLLQEQNLEVLQAEDGEEALKIYAKNKPHMVISDLKMPRMDGFELLQRLRAMNKDLPYILVSGYYDNIDDKEAQDIFQADHILLKPFEEEELIQIIKECFKKHGISFSSE